MSWRWLLLPALALLLLLLAALPLRQALSWAGAERWLAASRVEGTVWNGMVRQGRLGQATLGDARLSLDLPSLLAGRVAFRFTADGALAGGGLIAPDRENAVLRAALLRFPVGLLSPGLPLQGEMLLSDIDIGFRDGGCVQAQGAVLIRQARLEQNGVRLTPDTMLRGALGCAGNIAVLRLSGRSDAIRIHATLRIAADGAYRLESRVTGLARGSGAIAAQAGFRAEVDGYARVDQGRLAL